MGAWLPHTIADFLSMRRRFFPSKFFSASLVMGILQIKIFFLGVTAYIDGCIIQNTKINCNKTIKRYRFSISIFKIKVKNFLF